MAGDEYQALLLRGFYLIDGNCSSIGDCSCAANIYYLQHYQVIDARRREDGMVVAIKSCTNDSQEIEIAQYMTTARDPRNHCVRVLDVFPDPLDPDVTLLVMPYLRPCNDPAFVNVGEILDFIDQTLEVSCLCFHANLYLLRTRD